MGELPPKLLDLWMRLELLILVLHTIYNLDPLIQRDNYLLNHCHIKSSDLDMR